MVVKKEYMELVKRKYADDPKQMQMYLSERL